MFFKPEVVYLTQNIASELKTAANVKESQHKLWLHCSYWSELLHKMCKGQKIINVFFILYLLHFVLQSKFSATLPSGKSVLSGRSWPDSVLQWIMFFPSSDAEVMFCDQCSPQKSVHRKALNFIAYKEMHFI